MEMMPAVLYGIGHCTRMGKSVNDQPKFAIYLQEFGIAPLERLLYSVTLKTMAVHCRVGLDIIYNLSKN